MAGGDAEVRRCFDSTTASDIPLTSELVMGYVDGSNAWSDADWARCAGKVLVRLCIFNDRMDAQVIDIEPGNNDATGAVPWVKGKWARGEIPTVYCFSDRGPKGYTFSDVRAACDAAGVKRPLIFITDFDNVPALYPVDPEIVAKQYANAAITGAHYDASVVADFWPGVDSPDMTDDELRAAIKRIYAGPDSLEEWVKGDVRVMVQQDPETQAAIAAQAVKAVGAKLA